MSLQLTVDIKELYKELCPKCREKLVKLVKLSPNEDMIRKALEEK